jgi:N-acetylglutamate synthase-like GNAT family acetyltransferase
MKIRDYSEKDKSAIQNIFTRYWTDEEFLNELTEELNGEVCRFYVAEKDDEVVGIAGFRESPEYLRVYAETKNPAELYIVLS